ncbi:ABC transporter substrate-binding protein [Cereibacter johrii]|uniref:ABC transporter substrate-binding protein n=1 Tax=Cereibacter johrii TaxID=445629 RepID=UPI000DCB8C14|nr:extracellular solute-binding protein [Cereibacter johrii]RAZ82793.1 carbohydrate ABC transporter substrate-binding protein [Cereibacter johrii]
MTMRTTAASLLALALATGGSAAGAQTLEYWVYSDFAQGEALALQQEFIKEFQEAHPGVTVNIVGKGDDDLTAGQIAGAASGNLPDVFMNAVGVGAQLVDVGALANIHDKWMAMPEEFRVQFNKGAVDNCAPRPEEMYCIPYTGYGTLLFRNLTVLEAAGIDTSVPPADWADWLAQMEKVKAAGKFAIPDQALVFNSIAEMYGVTGDVSTWGIDWESKTTRIDPAVMTSVLEKFVAMQPLTSGTSRNDQATKDLFVTNQLAFHTIGPWVNPTYVEAAENSGLKYDFVLMPGETADKHGGIKNFEIVGVAPGENLDLAFEFATYITAKEQMARWAKLLSRYNSNAAAMAEADVAALPLVARSVEAVEATMDVSPPYLIQPVPACYQSTVVDYVSATADGEFTPEEGAEEMIAELNDCLAG